MVHAESPLAAQIIVLPPSCPSPPFLRSLRPGSPPLSVTLCFQGLHQPRVAWNEYTPKGGAIEDEEGGRRGFGMDALNGTWADKSEQSYHD
eukprot:4354534-Pyramimonas_sp.AAC.1